MILVAEPRFRDLAKIRIIRLRLVGINKVNNLGDGSGPGFGRRSRFEAERGLASFERLRKAWRPSPEDICKDEDKLGALVPERARRLVQLFEESGKGWFWETNRDGALVYLSQAPLEGLNIKHRDLLGRPFTSLLAPEDKGVVESTERSLRFYFSSRAPFKDVIVRANAKEETWWAVSGQPITDEFDKFFGFRGIATDLTEQRRSEVELDRLARYDSLTGLANRTTIRRYLDDALWSAARNRHRCSVFMLDLDRFKAVNDTLGHPVGDTLLKLVALRLRDIVGECGQVGRLGGDEFQIVFERLAGEAELTDMAARIIEQVSQPYRIAENSVSIGTSIGIVVSDYDDRTADDLVREADLALYAAKAAGKGTHCFFIPDMNAEARQRRELETELRKAIAEDQLTVYYQPSVHLLSEEVVGFEALVRWFHPVRGAIPPSQFIPLAEETGLIESIGDFVLRTACADAAKWPSRIKLAVNLSPVQFTNSTLPLQIVNILAECGLPAEQLELEITEGVLLNDDQNVRWLIGQLKAIGVGLALDDFGTGYSGLGYLLKVPFDKIKIDQSFVRGASIEGSKNAAIIRAVVGLARELSMETTAEGVETHDELSLVTDLGCSLVQGYIYGKPMPAEEASKLVAEKSSASAAGFRRARAERRRLLRIGTLEHGSRKHRVRLRNISAGGALVECSVSLVAGTLVLLDIGIEELLEAEVRWMRGNQAGLQFRDPIDLGLLASASQGGKIIGLRPDYLSSPIFKELLEPEGKPKLKSNEL